MCRTGYRLGFLLLFSFILPSLAQAQIEGRVLDESGAPIPHATVQLRGAGSNLATAMTDSAGRFLLRIHPQGESLTASALGMASREAPLGDLMHPMEIVLLREPISLPLLEATAAAFRCPEADDSRARELWVQAMARYEPMESGLFLSAEVAEKRRGETWPEDFGNTDALSITKEIIGGRVGPDYRWSEQAIRENGYALPEKWSSLDGRTEAWRYLDLGGAQAHFLTFPWFPDLLTMGVAQDDDRGVTIAFCDLKGRRRPGIQGQVHIDAEGWVRDVEWKMPTPPPEEDSGGQVYFGAASEFLLPESSVFWRKTSMGKYFQETRRFGPWHVGEKGPGGKGN